MTSRVCEHPPSLAVRLILWFACSEPQQRSLGEVEVIDFKVEVKLLRLFLSRPLRGLVVRHVLEAQEEAVWPAQTRESLAGKLSAI